MKINEFIKDYSAQNFINTSNGVEEKIKYLKKKLNVKPYIPFTEKRELCETVLDGCCETVGSIVEVDSVSRYLFFTIAIIAKYTDLEFGKTDGLDSVDEYDMLCQIGALNEILAVIGGEYEVCNNILNMMMADIDANNNNMAVVLDHAVQKLLGSVDKITDALAKKISGIELDLSQFNNIEKLTGLLEKLPQR